MIIDANLLLYAVDSTSPQHTKAATWLTDVLNGDRRVGLPWQSIGAFVRVITHPRITTAPLTGPRAWGHVERWLAADPVWVPPAGRRTAALFGGLVAQHGITGNLVTDAQLAALALEHGLTVHSADSDFARFPEVSWTNPLA